MNGFDIIFCIIFQLLIPVYASMSLIDLCLNVKNRSYSTFWQNNNVVFNLRVGTDWNMSETNLIEIHCTNKICIIHFNMTIYQVNLIHISPNSIFVHFRQITTWIKYLKATRRLAFPNNLIQDVIAITVLINKLFRKAALWESNINNPGSDNFSCEPDLLRSYSHI